jgi:hypothetical protein
MFIILVNHQIPKSLNCMKVKKKKLISKIFKERIIRKKMQKDANLKKKLIPKI